MAVYYNSEINRRSSNEDSFCDIEFRVNHEAAVHVMTVADGMGGLAGGKYYSETAIGLLNEKLLRVIMNEEFRDSSLHEQKRLLTEFLRQIFQQINQELYTSGLNAGIKGGTTLTAAIHFWHCFIIANCGDSPVYCMKEGRLRLASDIQNAAWHMVLEGKTEEGSVVYYQNKTRLLQYLGRRDQVTPYILVLNDEEVDCLLMGTDGAFGSLNQNQIAQILMKNTRREKLLQELFDAAKSDGEEDNQTAILFVSKEKELKQESLMVEKQIAGPEDATVPGIYKKAGQKKNSLRERLFGYRSLEGKD